MPRRKTQFHPGEYYHVYNRGVNRGPIYFESANYAHFLRKMREFIFGECRSDDTVFPCELRPASVIAYCLMPNHYHLLVRVQADGFSDRMQSFMQAYTNAINRDQQRVGPLFQGRFQAIHVDQEEYLLHLSRYIHLNPVVAHLVENPEDWPFSSYSEFVGLRAGTIPEANLLRGTFPDPGDYRRFVESRAEELAIRPYLFDE